MGGWAYTLREILRLSSAGVESVAEVALVLPESLHMEAFRLWSAPAVAGGACAAAAWPESTDAFIPSLIIPSSRLCAERERPLSGVAPSLEW